MKSPLKRTSPALGDMETILAPVAAAGQDRATLDITVVVKGGGVTGQTDAVQLGMARALVKMSADNGPADAQGWLPDPRPARQGTQEARSQARPQGPDLHQALIPLVQVGSPGLREQNKNVQPHVLVGLFRFGDCCLIWYSQDDWTVKG